MIAYGQRPANLEGFAKGCADKAFRQEPGPLLAACRNGPQGQPMCHGDSQLAGPGRCN